VHGVEQPSGKPAASMRPTYPDHVEMGVQGFDDEPAGGIAEGLVALALRSTELPPDCFAPE
jgi:hypothetical protein